MKNGPLGDIRVVDLTRVLAGPYCTLLLAELGAEVIKVEAPERGDDARHIGPFLNGKSAYFMSINRGKRSIALDLKAAGDRAIFEALLANSDVLVENFRGGTMEKLGFGWEVLKNRFPRLVYCAVSGFGQTGPYKTRPAYDMVVQAMGGVMSLTGEPGGAPVRVGTSIGDITAGLFAALAVTAALRERERTGRGAMADIAMLDCQVAILENAIARYAATNTVPGPMGSRHPSIAPFAAFRAKDAHFVIAAGNDPLFARLAALLGKPELATDPRFATNALRNDNWEALKAAMEEALASRTAAEWIHALGEAGIPCGPINDVAAVMADPQIIARAMIVTADDPVAGPLKMPGNPMKFAGASEPGIRAPAPDLDADRARILEWLGLKP